MIEGVDYFLKWVRFPNLANPALTVVNDDGTFDVYLNTLYSREYLLNALNHELMHLKAEHFYVNVPARTAEKQANTGKVFEEVFHPPEGMLPHFFSQEHFAAWIKTVCTQNKVDLTKAQLHW